MMWRRMEIFSEESSPKMAPKVYNTAYSQVVTQPGTDAAQQDLTSVIGREPLFFFLKRLKEHFYLQSSSYFINLLNILLFTIVSLK